MTLISNNKITLTDKTSAPSVVGELVRNGNNLYYHNGTLSSQLSPKTEALIIAVSDESTALNGTETAKFVLPYGFEVTKVKASLNVTGSANVVVTVTRAGSALATVTISGTIADDSSPTNTTGSENDVISITTTSGTANATGLKVYLVGYQT